jgi:UDP-N-acetylmuramoyl-tripeptide--D-alanyl-D-alanine ligase
MKAALQTLAEIDCHGKKIAVLGDMFELGQHSRKQHRELGKAAAKAKIHYLYLLGQRAGEVRHGALGSGMRPEQIFIGVDSSDLARRLRDQVRRGDWLLFKGSRGMKMERVLQELKGGKA